MKSGEKQTARQKVSYHRKQHNHVSSLTENQLNKAGQRQQLVFISWVVNSEAKNPQICWVLQSFLNLFLKNIRQKNTKI